MQSEILLRLCAEGKCLQEKLQYWKGIRDKVLETIRAHRSNTQQSLIREVVPGEIS